MSCFSSRIEFLISLFLLLLLFVRVAYSDDLIAFSYDKEGKYDSSDLLSIKDEYVKLNLSESLSAKEGAISFWIYPHSLKDNNTSRTILSLGWENYKNSYLVISHGWWEPTGSNRLYFVLSNEDFVHCSSDRSFDFDTWTFVTVTWKSGNNGYCGLYMNGIKIAESSARFSGEYHSYNEVYIGSDKGTNIQRGRKAFFDIKDIRFSKKYMNALSIENDYKRKLPQGINYQDEQWAWLYKSISNYNNSVYESENRYIFDEDMFWAQSKENTDRLLNKIKRSGFNVYVPCVWHGQGTYYPTSVSRMDKRLSMIGYDPLQYLIESAHKLGIKVYPWVTVVRREDGIYPQFSGDGVPENAFNIHNPEFRIFITNLVSDLAERYDIDGINLDYVRSMGICSSKYCAEDYKIKYGGNISFDKYARYLSKESVVNISDWNRKSMDLLIRSVSEGIRKYKTNVVISVDANPLENDLILQGQDSIGWLSNGLIDLIFNMDYKKYINYSKADMVYNLLKSKDGMVMLLSTYDIIDGKVVHRDPLILSNYVKYVRVKWPGTGIAFYHLKQLTDQQASYLSSGVFKN